MEQIVVPDCKCGKAVQVQNGILGLHVKGAEDLGTSPQLIIRVDDDILHCHEMFLFIYILLID